MSNKETIRKEIESLQESLRELQNIVEFMTEDIAELKSNLKDYDFDNSADIERFESDFCDCCRTSIPYHASEVKSKSWYIGNLIDEMKESMSKTEALTK